VVGKRERHGERDAARSAGRRPRKAKGNGMTRIPYCNWAFFYAITSERCVCVCIQGIFGIQQLGILSNIGYFCLLICVLTTASQPTALHANFPTSVANYILDSQISNV
jgi:hypothetical protein